MSNKRQNIEYKAPYRIRMMGCIVIMEIIALSIFNLWPITETDKTKQEVVFSEDNIIMDEVVITRQQDSPPPPPKPQIPVPEPTDEVIEEEIITLDDISISELSDSMSVELGGAGGDSDQAMENPQTSPSVLRIVEPTVPEAAKKAKVKAEIWVNFLVDSDGKVEEATIAQIRLYDSETKDYRIVNTIDYGLTEATIKAALQWKFRPAKDNGQQVKAYSKHIFTYGF